MGRHVDDKVVHEQLVRNTVNRIHDDMVSEIGCTYRRIENNFWHVFAAIYRLTNRRMVGIKNNASSISHPCALVLGTKITNSAVLAYVTNVAEAAPIMPYSGIHQLFSPILMMAPATARA